MAATIANTGMAKITRQATTMIQVVLVLPLTAGGGNKGAGKPVISTAGTEVTSRPQNVQKRCLSCAGWPHWGQKRTSRPSCTEFSEYCYRMTAKSMEDSS